MEYECQLTSMDKTIVTERGVVLPLCNDCTAPDCSNPIREQTVYCIGKPIKMRLWIVNNTVRQVVACRGYIGGQHVSVPGV